MELHRTAVTSASDEGIGDDEYFERRLSFTERVKPNRKLGCNHATVQPLYKISSYALHKSGSYRRESRWESRRESISKSWPFWRRFPWRRRIEHGKTQSGLAESTKHLFYPATSVVNVKLFGGKVGVQQEITRCQESPFIIHPCSNFRQYWDLVIMITMALNVFILPIDIAFSPATAFFTAFHIISDLLCAIDIILNFRTAYHKQDDSLTHIFEMDGKKVALHYLKTWFVLDLISSIPFHYLVFIFSGETISVSLGLGQGASRALKILKVAKILNLLKLLRLSRIIRGISEYEEVYCVTAILMRYIKLLLMMLLVAHWNGCFHFFIPMMQDFPEDCWVQRCHLVGESWYEQYSWALFKTLSHMLCIGYGRFHPAILSEAIATICTMVIGATFYALFVAHSMAVIIHNDSSKNRFQEKFNQIDEYMSYRRLPEGTKQRVRTYFDRKYHSGRFFDENKVLAEVSPPLKQQWVCQSEALLTVENIWQNQVKRLVTNRSLPTFTFKCLTTATKASLLLNMSFHRKNMLSKDVNVKIQDILNHTCRSLIENMSFLRSSSEVVISTILNHLSYEVFLSGDHIIHEGGIDKQLFFIRKGSAEITMGGHSIDRLHQGSYFGELSAFTGHRNLYSVRATRTCDVFMLKKPNLDEINEEHPTFVAMLEHAALTRLIQICDKCCALEENDNIILSEAINESIQKTFPVFIGALQCSMLPVTDILQACIEQHHGNHKDCNLCTQCLREIENESEDDKNSKSRFSSFSFTNLSFVSNKSSGQDKEKENEEEVEGGAEGDLPMIKVVYDTKDTEV